MILQISAFLSSLYANDSFFYVNNGQHTLTYNSLSKNSYSNRFTFLMYRLRTNLLSLPLSVYYCLFLQAFTVPCCSIITRKPLISCCKTAFFPVKAHIAWSCFSCSIQLSCDSQIVPVPNFQEAIYPPHIGLMSVQNSCHN